MDALNGLRRFLPACISLRLTDWRSKSWYLHKLRAGRYDAALITSPYFEDMFLDFIGTKPYLMVVHDTMRSVSSPDGFIDGIGCQADRLAYLARRAAGVVCISGTVQRELLDMCGIGNGRTRVIPPCNLLEGTPVEPAMALPERYLLFTGERRARKNFRFFIRAVAPVLKKYGDIYLVSTGRFDRWERDDLESLGVSGRCLDVEADEGTLVYLYRRALCLVYPTLYEGFGFPALEAMASGCPVLASDTGPIRELGGSAVEYADPYSADSISAKVELLIGRPDHRRRLSELGLERARLFSRQKMAEEFLTEFAGLKNR
jgi:glycosyltransferase involved in cell wall biosynthesis